jgi:hypothetical protein
MRKIYLLVPLALFTLYAHTTFAAALSSASMSNFLVQDVCLNKRGTVLPLPPSDPSCAKTRELKVGERLPYHKQDHHGTDTNPEATEGYQRSDSFPSRDRFSYVQTFDFGVGGRTFETKDAGDGFNIYENRGKYTSIIATQDGGAGLQFFLNPTCDPKAKDFSNINDSWILSPNKLSSGAKGETQARLIVEKKINTCPSPRYDQSFTRWTYSATPFSFTSGHELPTVISEHYSHPTITESDHIEMFYFTDEFGATRWERWERPGTQYNANVEERGKTFAASERCNGAKQKTDSTGTWYMVDCRDWTNIVPATNSGGDAPNEWGLAILTGSQTNALTTATSLGTNLGQTLTESETKVQLEEIYTKLKALLLSIEKNPK